MTNFLFLTGADHGEKVFVNPRHVTAIVRHSLDPKNPMARAQVMLINGMAIMARESMEDIQAMLDGRPVFKAISAVRDDH